MTEKQQKKLDKMRDRYEYKVQKEKIRCEYKNKVDKMFLGTYTKRLVAGIIAIALLDLQITYLLAYMDKIQNAETLSVQLVTTILGVAIVYMIRAYFDTKAEHNETKGIPNKSILDKIMDKSIQRKETELLNNAGIPVDTESIEQENTYTEGE